MNWKSRVIRASCVTLFLGSHLMLATASIALELILNGNAEAYAKKYLQSSSQAEKCGASNVFCSNQETQTRGETNFVSNTAIQSSIVKTKPYALDGNNSTSPHLLNMNDNINEECSNSDGSLTDKDPTLLVLPCCDEMPADFVNSA
jgi:hypothetical protein